MKLDRKKVNFFVATLICSVVTIVFAILSIVNEDNWLFRIGTQASLALSMIINGAQTLIIQKNKKIAYLLIGVSVFILFVMVDTIIVGYKTGKIY